MKADLNIVVDTTRMDDYGNQFITDTSGNEHKVGAKRSHLHVLAQQGLTLTFKYDNFKNIDYIADIVVVGVPAVPVTPSEPQGDTPTGKTAYVPRGDERGMALKEIGEGLRANKFQTLSENQMKMLIAYYQAEIFKSAGFEFPEE